MQSKCGGEKLKTLLISLIRQKATEIGKFSAKKLRENNHAQNETSN